MAFLYNGELSSENSSFLLTASIPNDAMSGMWEKKKEKEKKKNLWHYVNFFMVT